jgi:hypothetical protein
LIGAGRESEPRADRLPVRVRDRLHLQRVADQNAVEAQLITQQAAQDAGAQRGRAVGIQRGEHDMRAHQHRHAYGDRGPEGVEVEFVVRPWVDRHIVVAVGDGAPVPREVLGAGGDSARLSGGDPGAQMPGDQLRVGAERAGAHDRVQRMVLQVGDRGVRGRDAERGQVSGQCVGTPGGEPGVVHDAQGEGAGDFGCARAHQVADAAALVVDGHQEIGPEAAQRVREFADLFRVANIAREQDDAAEAAVDEPLQSVGDGRGSVESGDEAAVDRLVQVGREGGRTTGVRVLGVGHLGNPLVHPTESQ